MHEWIVDADGQPTDLTVQISHFLVGSVAAWAVHQAFGRRYVALLTFAVGYAAHSYFDGPVAKRIAALA
jgi:hypothetical protein